MDSTTTSLLACALRYARRGWPVFPVRPGGKRPVWRDWEGWATTDPDKITRFATAHPHHNFGFAAGRADTVVVDLDMPKPDQQPPESYVRRGIGSGAGVLAHLATEAGATIPDTYTVATPSGGTHLYFRQPAGARLGQTHHRAGWLIDTRGIGGQVLIPASTTPDGAYELIRDTEPVELPGWLHRLLEFRPSPAITAPHRITTGDINSYVRTALAGECERLARAPQGQHNTAQLAAGRAIGELVGAGLIAHAAAHAALMQQALSSHVTGRCGCTERGITAVLHSALNYGARTPRHINHPQRDTAR